jgi:uncharacterized protein (DUF1015 family)
MRLRPIQALRPVPQRAGEIACLPYDVVSAAEARQTAARNPLSFMRVVRAEVDLPPDTDPYAPAVYQQAAARLATLCRDGLLVDDPQPAIYVYQQQMGNHCQRGLTALCHIDDYEQNVIRKHERTRQAKEDDRLRLNTALQAHPGLVFLTVRDDQRLAELLDTAARDTPFFDFVADDGVRHTAWRVTDTAPWVDVLAAVPTAYVADGHHRSASAWRLGKACAQANPQHSGEEAYNWFPAVIFPASQLRILPYNRLVSDLRGRTVAEFLAAVEEQVSLLEPHAEPVPDRPGRVSMFIDGQWYGLQLEAARTAGPVDRLDVQLLQDQVLRPLLGIDDPRTDDRIDFVGGIRGTAALEEAVRRGDAAVAFSLYPVTVEQLMDIADADEIMPPKSTWFEPKLRSGLFIHRTAPPA